MNKKILVVDILGILLSIFLFLFDLQKPLDDFIYQHILFNDTLTILFKGITILANTLMAIIVISCTFYYLIRKRRVKEGVNFTIFTIFSCIIMFLLKALFKRERPNIKRLIEITGFSFPSGHAYTSIIIYGYIIYLINHDVKGKRKIIYITVVSILIVLIGISRIYLGVHYLTDIIFGYSLGLFNLHLFLNYQYKIVPNKGKYDIL